jgi:hypothetical protein
MSAMPSIPELQLIALHHFGDEHGYQLTIDRLPAGSPYAWRLQFQRAGDPFGVAGGGYFGKALDTAAEIPAAVRELWGVVTRWDSYRASCGREPVGSAFETLDGRQVSYDFKIDGRSLGLSPAAPPVAAQDESNRITYENQSRRFEEST